MSQATFTSEKAKQRKEAQLRRVRNVGKRIDRTTIPTPPKKPDTIKTFVFIVAKPGTHNGLQAAYEALQTDRNLRIYYPRFKHSNVWQECVMKGVFEVELPFCIGAEVLSHLAPAWRLGKL